MNMFVVRSLIPGVPLATVFAGVLPFAIAEVILLAILVAVPQITLFLPNLLFK
jgi:TRAP-type C4-dicarboxylate transport system permease large subunit